MGAHVRNTILALAISVGICVSFFYLEKAFRRGDSRRAIQAVQQLRTKPGGPTVQEDLNRQFGPDAQMTWISAVEDNFKGVLRVVVTLPDQSVRRWRVDLVHGTISEI